MPLRVKRESSAPSGNCWTPSRPMFTGLHSEMRQTAPQFVRFSRPRSQIPKSEIGYAVCGMPRIGHPMSHPGGIGHPMSDGYPGERVRVGKEGRKEGTSGPLDKEKPRRASHTGREENETLSYSRLDARADKSIKRKQRKQRARNPRARTKGFIRSCRSKGERKGTRGDKSRRAPRCTLRSNMRARLRQTRHAERKQRWSLRSWSPRPRFRESHRQRFGRGWNRFYALWFSYVVRASIARGTYRFPDRLTGQFRHRQSVSDPYRGQGCKEPAGRP